MIKSKAFDLNARKYDDWFETHAFEYNIELEAIRALIPESGTGIEIGVGTGRFAKPLGISIGIEPSESMREIALERGINAIAGTAESIPIYDNQYDYALLVTTVCFLESLETAFIEISRILKNSGFIILGFIDKDSVLGKKYEQNKDENVFYKDATFHSAEEITHELTNAGFENFEYIQALLPGDNAQGLSPEIKKDYGEGSFIVLRAQKIISA